MASLERLVGFYDLPIIVIVHNEVAEYSTNGGCQFDMPTGDLGVYCIDTCCCDISVGL